MKNLGKYLVNNNGTVEYLVERMTTEWMIPGSIPGDTIFSKFFVRNFLQVFLGRKNFWMQFVEYCRENAKKREKRNSSNFVVRKNGIGGAKCNFSS